MIPNNMSRHIRLEHATCQCYWRCPVASCPGWFASEFEGKEHMEETHLLREGRGYSYYECLRLFGLEWFGRRSFFDQRGSSGQALWMDIALARKSGQELRNEYIITYSPALDDFRLFFRTAVRELVCAYLDCPRPRLDASVAFTVQITFIFIDFRVCDFAFAFKTQNAPCVSRFKRVLFSDRFQFAF